MSIDGFWSPLRGPLTEVDPTGLIAWRSPLSPWTVSPHPPCAGTGYVVPAEHVANSFLPVAVNLAIFAAGVSGALLLELFPPAVLAD